MSSSLSPAHFFYCAFSGCLCTASIEKKRKKLSHFQTNKLSNVVLILLSLGECQTILMSGFNLSPNSRINHFRFLIVNFQI